jgi:hypothetical protein
MASSLAQVKGFGFGLGWRIVAPLLFRPTLVFVGSSLLIQLHFVNALENRASHTSLRFGERV